MQVYSRKYLVERSQINNQTLHLNELQKEKIKPQINIRKEIIKTRAEINKREHRKTIKAMK